MALGLGQFMNFERNKLPLPELEMFPNNGLDHRQASV
jgi:hypothetical protein